MPACSTTTPITTARSNDMFNDSIFQAGYDSGYAEGNFERRQGAAERDRLSIAHRAAIYAQWGVALTISPGMDDVAAAALGWQAGYAEASDPDTCLHILSERRVCCATAGNRDLTDTWCLQCGLTHLPVLDLERRQYRDGYDALGTDLEEPFVGAFVAQFGSSWGKLGFAQAGALVTEE
jgi:hypothetical protein